MNSQVLHALRAVLTEERTASLPGIGTFRLSPQPALISPIEGRALPPVDRVAFNANLTLDDGRLLRHLTAEDGLPRPAAEALLAEFLQQVAENLDSGRSVTLQGIGRLYKHHDGRITLSPTADNFSKENFGLPAVAIKQIVRTERQKIDALSDPVLGGLRAETTTAAAAGARAAKGRRRRPGSGLLYNDRLRSLLWYVAIGLASLIGLFLVYRIGQTMAASLTENPRDPIVRRDGPPRERLNVPPPPRLPRETVPAQEVRPDQPPRLNTAPGGGSTTDGNSTGTAPAAPPPAAPRENVALIAIGLYGRQANVRKNTQRLEAAGYRAVSRPEGRYYRIAARVTYTEPGELDRALADLRRRFTVDAFVIEVNGERRDPPVD